MTNEQYHADASRISKSGLDKINRSPAHYWESYLNPNRREREEKDYFLKGTASHALILEPNVFHSEYYLFDDSEKVAELERNGSKRPRLTSEYKSWKEGVIMENEGLTPLPPQDYEYYSRILDAVHSHPAARAFLQKGVAEKTFFWEDFETGAPCKCRPDFLDVNNDIIVDLKFVKDASKNGFGRAAYNHRYHVQAPFYLDGVLASESDFIPQGFVFIAVEKEPPYAVAVYLAEGEVLQLGRREYTRNLETYMECINSGRWPSYNESISPLSLPNYAFKNY